MIGGRVELGAEGYRFFFERSGKKGRVRGEFAERYTLSVAHHSFFFFYSHCTFI